MRPSIALQTHRDAIREIALRHRVSRILDRHAGMDCRYPEHMDVNVIAIHGFWVPVIHAGTMARAFASTEHCVFRGEIMCAHQ